MKKEYQKLLEDTKTTMQELRNYVMGGYESNSYNDVHLRSKIYSRFNKDYCDYFRINARANTLSSKFDEALRYIDMWQPDTNMRLMIQNANSQMKIEDIA